jgi:heat shock transcription factor
MASRGLSRKRPAPESPPMQHQQPTGMAHAMNGYGAAVGPQLSDEQFLEWGQQTAQPLNQYSDPAYYQSMNSIAPSNAQVSNQLTRRPMNQVATRPKQPENATSGWFDGNGGNNGPFPQQQVDSGSGDDIEELKRRAAIAKRDAEAKRKQIPPFVQKLSR